jgi:HEAT repeat protein
MPAIPVRASAAEPVAAPTVALAAPAPEPAPVAPAPPVSSLKQPFPYTEYELREKLAVESKELDIDAEKGTTAKLLAEAKKSPPKADAKQPTPPVLELIARRADLRGLPVRQAAECAAPAKEAKALGSMSTEVRTFAAKYPGPADGGSSSASFKRDQCFVGYLEKKTRGGEWQGPEGVRLLVQMFQTENAPVRTQLVRSLADNKAKDAAAAVARRAVFDLDFEVRVAAVKALKGRDAKEYRPALLEALCYPWPPVAVHAAEALVALDDRAAVADLVLLLDRPDPQAPVQTKDKKWVAAELVRVNHLGNCVLCHAPSTAKDDLVRGVVPVRGEPLPEVYYESKSGSFVRADVTYLRQDFSVMQVVPEPGKWPRVQRFDYLVRQRELSDDEVKRLTAAKGDEPGGPPSYPQREAVLWALRQLTGQDLGDRSEDWREYLAKDGTKRAP